MLKPNPQCDGIRRWGLLKRQLGSKGAAIMSEISAFTKETPESTFTPSTMWGHSKKTAMYEPDRDLSPDTESANALILDFPASREINTCCL